MNKFLSFLMVFLVGSSVFATTLDTNIAEEQNVSADVQEEVKTEENSDVKEVKPELSEQKPEYFTEFKKNQTFYYDKSGKLIARDKKIKNETFFYDNVGQLVGKSVEKNDKTFYYNRISKFIGYCDENSCVDSKFVSTGKIPPLPAIKHFVPVYDNNIMNPPPKVKTDDEE